MERKDYIEPSYEILLLNCGSVITESGRDPWEGGHMPLGMSRPSNSGTTNVWSEDTP